MKKLLKYFCGAAIIATACLLAFGGVRSTRQVQPINTGTITLPGDPSLYYNGQGNWISPINQLGLTTGTIPMSFQIGPGNYTLVDSFITQSFTGDLTVNGTRLTSVYDLVLRHIGANKLPITDANSKIVAATIGTGLSLSGGVLSATSGNVTATPTTGAVSHIAKFDNDAGTDITESDAFLSPGTGGGDDLTVNGVINANSINVSGTITGQVTVNGVADGVAQGSYVPTRSFIANTDNAGTSPHDCYWTRVGNVVTVGGRVEAHTPGGTAGSRFQIDLPVPCDLTLNEQLNGWAASVDGVSPNIAIIPDNSSDKADFIFTSTGAAFRVWSFQFSYVTAF